MKTRTSTSFIRTVDPSSAEDMDWLKQFRANKPAGKYVKCQGRWGVKNPAVKNKNYQGCPLSVAVRWDVYLYNR